MNTLIAGLDEVGMGCLAGPVIVVVTAFPKNRVRIAGVRDSKACTKRQILNLSEVVAKEAAWLGFGYGSVDFINEYGIALAWESAAEMALKDHPSFELLIIDGVRTIDVDVPQKVLPKADILHWQVSAASIVAKRMRDQSMEELSEHYPDYKWETNVGYGTEDHVKAIKEFGPSPYHRTKFLRKILE